MVRDHRQTVKKAFESFLTYKQVMNCAEKTIVFYEMCYRFFVEFYGEDNPCSEITEQTIIDYLLYLKENKNLAAESVATYLRGLRAIIYFFAKNKYLERFQISLPKTDDTIK